MTTVKVVKDNWRDVSVRLDRGVADGVRDAAFAVEGQIVANITTQGLVDTGNYRRSWTTDIDSDGRSAEVGSPVEYGVYLEYGTRFMPPRGHVVKAAESVGRRIADYFRRLER